MVTAPRVEGTRAEKRLPGPEILFLQDIFNATVSVPGLTRTIKGGRLPRSCQWKKKNLRTAQAPHVYVSHQEAIMGRLLGELDQQ